jgi:hypothetical protein
MPGWSTRTKRGSFSKEVKVLPVAGGDFSLMAAKKTVFSKLHHFIKKSCFFSL